MEAPTPSFIDRLNPYADGSTEESRTGGLVVVFSLITIATGVFFVLFFAAIGLTGASVGSTAGLIGASFVLRTFRHDGDQARAARVLAASVLTSISCAIWATGGMHSDAMAWLVVGPLLASMLAGRKTGAQLLVLVAIAMLGLLGLDFAGIRAPELPESIAWTMEFVAPVALVGFSFAVTWTYDVATEAAAKRLDESRLATERARDEAERAREEAQAVLDNVAEGLALLDDRGVFETARSASLDTLFGPPDEGVSIWEFLRPHDPVVAQFVELGWDQLSDGWLPPEVALAQFPARLESGKRIFDLSWSIAGDGRVLFVATDATARIQAERERAAHEELAEIMARVSKNRAAVVDFFAEARRIVDALSSRDGSAEQERRWIHTLKGNSAVMGLDRLARGLHELESAMAPTGRRCSDVERSNLREHWGNLEARFGVLLGNADEDCVRITTDELDLTLQLLAGSTSRERIAARMESWGWDEAEARLTHLGEQAKRIAQRLDKAVDVVVDGRGIRTPPTARWRALWSALVHLARNAIDHGLEANRAAAGKNSTGLLEMYASVRDGSIRIELRDDGSGIDWAALEARAGHPLSTKEERLAWLFTDGSSSCAEVTEFSGRGVGTAAVRDAVEALGGTIDVDTEPGAFTKFTLHVPLAASVAGLRPVAATA